MFNLSLAQFSILHVAAAGVIYFMILYLFYNIASTRRYVMKIFAKNKFNIYSIFTTVAIFLFIYQKPILELITNPPPFAFLIAVVLFLLTNYQNQNKSIIEAQNMFTKAQCQTLDNSITRETRDLEAKFDKKFDDLETKFDKKFDDLETKFDENAKLIRQIAAHLNIIPTQP